MKDLSDVVAMVVDHGSSVNFARMLGRAYRKVYYYTPNLDEYPEMKQSCVGLGYPEIEVVHDFYHDNYDDVDLLCYPDVGFGREQVRHEAEGKIIWGSKMGERLEQDRIFAKELFKKLGFAVGPYEVVTGIPDLRKYLKEHKDQWVKISKWRGDFESFFSPNYKTVELDIDEREHNLGELKHITEFIVEDDLPDMVEVGSDTYFAGGRYPETAMAGIEIKDKMYAGLMKPTADLAEQIRGLNEALIPFFTESNYCCKFSTEIRIDKKGLAYPLDMTCRHPSPPGDIQDGLWSNMADIVWQGANGVCVDPKARAKYGVQIILLSDKTQEKMWQALEFPKSNEKYLAFKNSCHMNDRNYIIPLIGLKEFGSAIGYGHSLKDAFEMAAEVADSVEGSGIYWHKDAFEKAEEQFEKLDKQGLSPL